MASSTARGQPDSARALIQWALQGAERPILTTKFGPDSAVLLHLATRVRPEVPVVWVDTGYNTRDTLRFAEQLSRRLQLDLRVYRPRGRPWAPVPALDDPAHQAFSRRLKLEPFQRALRELAPDLWLTALRAEQTAHRACQPQVRRDRRGYLKVAPLLHWRDTDMAAYRRRYDLPRGPECYDPTKGEPRRECGLHLAY